MRLFKKATAMASYTTESAFYFNSLTKYALLGVALCSFYKGHFRMK